MSPEVFVTVHNTCEAGSDTSQSNLTVASPPGRHIQGYNRDQIPQSRTVHCYDNSTSWQSQTAVTAYFSSKQLLLFALQGRASPTSHGVCPWRRFPSMCPEPDPGPGSWEVDRVGLAGGVVWPLEYPFSLPRWHSICAMLGFFGYWWFVLKRSILLEVRMFSYSQAPGNARPQATSDTDSTTSLSIRNYYNIAH